MIMQVYRLFDKGFRLHRGRVFAVGAVQGELILKDRPDRPREGVLIAQLMRPDLSYLLPVLGDARIVCVTRRGFLIEGREIIPPRGAKGFDTRYQQAWWCELVNANVNETTDKTDGIPKFSG